MFKPFSLPLDWCPSPQPDCIMPSMLVAYLVTSVRSLISARDASPKYCACAGGSSENNSATRNCAGRSSESGAVNRVFIKVGPQNTSYSVIWSVCGWNQLTLCRKLGINISFVDLQCLGLFDFFWQSLP